MRHSKSVFGVAALGFGLVQSVRVHRYSEVTSGKGSFV